MWPLFRVTTGRSLRTDPSYKTRKRRTQAAGQAALRNRYEWARYLLLGRIPNVLRVVMRIICRALAMITSFLGASSLALAASLNSDDAEFLRKAAELGQLEIHASRVAHQQSDRAEVRKYAETMITEYGEVASELSSLVQAKGVSLPATLGDAERQNIAQWQGLEVHEFNRRYIGKIAIEAHENAVDTFRKAADDASDADVKAFAEKTLPRLQRHLARGKLLQETLEAGPRNREAASGPPTSPATPDRSGTGGGEPTNEPPPESPNQAADSQ